MSGRSIKNFPEGITVLYQGDRYTYLGHADADGMPYFIDIRNGLGIRRVHEHYVTPLEEKVATKNDPSVPTDFKVGDWVRQVGSAALPGRITQLSFNRNYATIDWGQRITENHISYLELAVAPTEIEPSKTPIADQEKSIEDELIEYLGGIVKSATTRIEKAASTIAAAQREVTSAKARQRAAENIIADLKERNQ